MTNAEAITRCLDQGLIAYPGPTQRASTSGRPPKTAPELYIKALAYVEAYPDCSLKQAAEDFGISYESLRKERQKRRKAER